MIQQRFHERGFVSIGMLYLIGTALGIILLLFKLGPVYLSHYKVITSLESLKTDSNIGQKTRTDIVSMLEKRWIVDDITEVSKDDVTIERDGSQMTVRVAYDVVTPILGNVSALMHFDDGVEVTGR